MELERELSRRIKQQVRKDRATLLDNGISRKDLNILRQLRKKTFRHDHIDLKNDFSSEPNNHSRSETLAEYFSRIQWAVRPLSDPPANQSGNCHPLHVDEGPIQFYEVIEAAAQIK